MPDWRPDPRSLQGWNATRRSMAARRSACPLFRFHVVTTDSPVGAVAGAMHGGSGGGVAVGGGGGARQLDWVYANIEGVTVVRRAHQQVSVPWRGRYVYQTEPGTGSVGGGVADDCELDMLIHEDTQWDGHTQPHSPGLPMEAALKKKKTEDNDACLQLLEQDYLEDGSEPRTLYYLGLHYKTAYEQHDDNSTEAALSLLNSSHHFLHLRARIDERGDAQERWWATILLGQIHLYVSQRPGDPVSLGSGSGGDGTLKAGGESGLAEAGKWLKRAVTLDGTRQEPYAMLAERYVSTATCISTAMRTATRATDGHHSMICRGTPDRLLLLS